MEPTAERLSNGCSKLSAAAHLNRYAAIATQFTRASTGQCLSTHLVHYNHSVAAIHRLPA